MFRSIPRTLAFVLGLSLLAAACGGLDGGTPVGPPPDPRPDGDVLQGGTFDPYDATLWRLMTIGDATLEAATCEDFDTQCVVVSGNDFGGEPYSTQLVYWDDGADAPRFLELSPGAYRLHARVRASSGGASAQVVILDGSYLQMQALEIAPTRASGNFQTDVFRLDEGADVTFRVNLGGEDNAGTTFWIDDLWLAREGDVAAPPTFTPTPARYSATQNVTLATATIGAAIHYTMTTDGSEPADPTAASPEYTAPIELAQPSEPGAETVFKFKAVAVADGMTNSRIESATYTIENPSGDWALRIEGTSGSGSGEIAVSIQFNMGVTDFTTEDYTASYDIYIPETSTLPGPALQTQYTVDPGFPPMYFNTYSPFPTNTWQTRTYTLTKANRAWPTSTDAAPLISDANRFRIVFQTPSAGQAVVFYVKNIRVTNGTHTPLDIVFTETTNLDALGIYHARGEFTHSLARR